MYSFCGQMEKNRVVSPSVTLLASIEPDEIAYISVLCASSHATIVDRQKFFAVITAQHGVEPTVTHYGCTVDLPGRAGRLQEAH
ncbi:hypothetical protein V6N11_066017 [Hibiscus sabdariffa]|uniref:Uncharacterized protein n=1 Tax=Hibiscus sabdariffa TaxID=183260 RepID=A0ABR2NUF1_9ROSI